MLVALLVFAAWSLAARCYEKDTRVVVFVQGLYTYLNEDGTQGTSVEDHRFDRMKGAFLEKGYTADDLLDFSYNGGTVTDDGVWQPNDYPCEATDRPSATSVARLEEMLAAYREKHPKAHFTLVGHSLGGYIAFLAASRDATRSAEERLEIDGVVTLDAPLNGVSADKKLVIDLIPCAKTFQAGGELVADRANPDIVALRQQQVEAMRQSGMRVATIGNTRDCLYNTRVCTGLPLVDDSATQFIENADLVKRYDITSDAFASHDFIASFDPAINDVVTFTGEP